VSNSRIVLSPEQSAELRRLYAELAIAARKANTILMMAGMDSEIFTKADGEVTRLIRRIKEVHGTSGKDWMAV
jgi:hypothetical protein